MRIVRAYRLLILHGRGGEIFNVASGVPRTTGEIRHPWEVADPTREVVELYPGNRVDPVADIDRIIARTGWQPEIPLTQCVADTYRFWLDQSPAGTRPSPRSMRLHGRDRIDERFVFDRLWRKRLMASASDQVDTVDRVIAILWPWVAAWDRPLCANGRSLVRRPPRKWPAMRSHRVGCGIGGADG